VLKEGSLIVAASAGFQRESHIISMVLKAGSLIVASSAGFQRESHIIICGGGIMS